MAGGVSVDMSIMEKDAVTPVSTVENLEMGQAGTEKKKKADTIMYIQAAVIIGGIFGAFLTWAYLQEYVYSMGTPGDMYRFHWFMIATFTFCSCIISTLANLILGFDWVLIGRIYKYMAITAIPYVCAMTFTAASLRHVTYPTQVLIKSAKLVPIVLGGLIIYRKTYPWYDYATVVLVTASLIVFGLNKPAKATDKTNDWIGIMLLMGALLADCFTGPRQDDLLKREPNVTSMQLMWLNNIFGCSYIVVASLAIEQLEPWRFCGRYPQTIPALLGYGTCGAIGQLFVFNSIKIFGSLYTSLFATVRKACTTVLSVYAFGHAVTPIQVISATVLFSTLIARPFVSRFYKNRSRK